MLDECEGACLHRIGRQRQVGVEGRSRGVAIVIKDSTTPNNLPVMPKNDLAGVQRRILALARVAHFSKKKF